MWEDRLVTSVLQTIAGRMIFSEMKAVVADKTNRVNAKP